MPTIYGAVDIVKNELRNAVMQNLGSAPASPVKGLMYFNSTDNTFYWYDGTAWQAAKGGTPINPATTVTTQAIGDAPVVGSLTTYAREDHKHGQPAFGAITTEQTFGASGGNGSAATIARSDHTHGNPVHDAAAHATIPLNALAAATNNYNMAGWKLTGLGAPGAAGDSATKGYVDGLINGLSWKDAVRAASTTNVALSGLATAVDGVTLVNQDRVLLKNQTTASQNGIWIAQAAAWVRATDAAAPGDILNAAVFVSEGTTQADTAWVMTTNAPITIDTTALTWVQFGGPTTYIGGAGLTLTGNTFDVGAGTGITVAADTVAVDTTVIATRTYVDTGSGVAHKYAAALTGTSSPETVTHNLATRDVQVTVLNGATPYTAVEVDWDATTTNTVTVRYNPNLGAGYRVVVVG